MATKRLTPAKRATPDELYTDDHLVSGYIRLFTHTQAIHFMPANLVKLCLFFYHIGVYFTNWSKHSIISNERRIMTQKKAHGSCYASVSMASTNNSIIYHYTIKILNLTQLSIGIDESKCKNINRCFCRQSNSKNYAYECDLGYKSAWYIGEYSERYRGERKNNDIVTMIYNPCEKSLSFGVNNKRQKMAFDNVYQEKGLSYRMCIWLNKGSSIQLIKLTTKKASESMHWIYDHLYKSDL
eukprot:375231_1